MVGDTLGQLTANYYAPCKHRVVALEQPVSGSASTALRHTHSRRSAPASRDRTVSAAASTPAATTVVRTISPLSSSFVEPISPQPSARALALASGLNVDLTLRQSLQV